MAITTLAATLTEAGAGSTTIAATKPTLTANLDVVLVASYTANAAPTSVPSGWTLIPSSSVTVSTWTSAGYYKVVRGSDVGSEASTYSWGFASSRATVIIRPYYGVNIGTPFDQAAATTASNSNATTVAIGAVVAPVDGTMLISGVGQDASTGTLTPPGSMTSVTTSTGTGKVANYAEETLTTGGSSGTRTWTFNSAVLAHGGWLAALRPAFGVRHVQAIGSNGSKSTGTTLAVAATPSPQPAVGELIVVACARDDVANDALTGDSVSDGHGNTYTRVVVAGSAGTDSTAANSVNAVIFYCVLTVAWSGTTTVTWTHPSLDARGMQIEHFAGDAGYDIVAYGPTASSNSASSTVTTPATTTNPIPDGGLAFGMVAVANDTSVTTTGDTDTAGGAWSTVTANVGTTGGTGNTNIYVATQHKLSSSPTIQSYNPTLGTSSACVNVLLGFFQLAQTGIAFVGAGPQAASSVASSQTCALAPNVVTDDLMLIVVGGRPTDNGADGVSIASGSDGWAQHGSTSYVAVAGVPDLSVQVWWKLHDGSETAPSVAVNTELAEVAASDRGYSVQMLAFRRVNTSTPFDVTAVISNTGAAAATFTPTGVTTATNGAMAVSVVVTADDNALNFNSPQSFATAMGGVDFDTAVGSDHAVAVGYKVIAAAGAVTMPTWNQSVNGNDQWVGFSTALKPLGSLQSLEGATNLTTTVSGALAATFPLTGSTALTTTVTGDLTVAHPFAGSATFTFATAGDLTVAHPLAGTTALTTALAGNLTAAFPLTGSTALTTATSGALAAGLALAGTTALTTALTGDLGAGVALTGSTTLTTALAGALAAGLALAGTTALTTALAGDLTAVVNHALEGATSLTTTLAGALTVAHPLDGATGFTTSTDGTLTLTLGLGLEGASSLTVALSGDLTFTLALVGASSLTTTLAGELTEILGPNAYLLGRVVATVVDTSIRATVIESPLTAAVLTDRIEASVR